MADVLGVVLAGGENRRFEGHKALATVGGRRIIDRVVSALSSVVPSPVIVANDGEPYSSLGLPVRPDARPGLGALGGIYTAVRWARESGEQAALVVACDMPFLHPDLLGRLVEGVERSSACLPASRGPRGFEPLCAAYGVACEPAIEETLERGELSIVAFLSRVRRDILPLEVVEEYGDPDVLFLNVNRPEDRIRAETVSDTGTEPDHRPAGVRE